MKRIGCVLMVVWGLWAQPASAACTGAGLTWNCTAGSTPSQVNTAIGSGTDGMTITVAAGSSTWGAGTRIVLPSAKAVTLICATTPPASSPWGAATSGGCDITSNDWTIDIPNATTNKAYRISGFNVALTGGGGSFISACPGGTCADTYVTNFRLDHTTVTRSTAGPIVFFSDNATKGYVEGVLDHNIFTNPATANIVDLFFSTLTTQVNGRLGTGHNLFVEDTTFKLTGTGSDDANGAGCIDGGDAVGVVVRFSTSDDCRILMHGVTHGWGPSNFELYFNTLRKKAGAALNTGYRLLHHQGSGTMMAFENVLAQSTGQSHDSDALVVLHYRAFQAASGCAIADGTVSGCGDGNRAPTATYRGYPAFHQPGRDYDGTLVPHYVWRNRWEDDSSKIDLAINGGGGGTDWTTAHLQNNRDIYNAVSASAQTTASSPFNGTTGMGYGTLANRPTTCTTGPEAADIGNGGVGYWATDQGEWNSTNGATPDGQLYKCTATNTWTLSYIPYQYPHPLVGAATGGSSDAPTTNPGRGRFLRRGLDAMSVIQQILHQPSLLVNAIF